MENLSHRKIIPTRSSTVRVKIKDRVKFMVRVRVRVSVSYIMTICRWEEFSMCDKFPTTPVRIDALTETTSNALDVLVEREVKML